jgi:hypothetical protein
MQKYCGGGKSTNNKGKADKVKLKQVSDEL